MEETAPLALAAAPSRESSSPPEPRPFDQDVVMDLQLKCIIKCNLPFHITEAFNEFAESLQPKYERVSQTTIMHLAFTHYIQAKKDLIKYFQNFQGKVSLTIHAWKTVDDYNPPYHCITCHWIDPETWKMSKRVIGLEQYEDVNEIIMPSISEFNLKDKIMSITFDHSVKNYEKSIETLKRELNPMFNGVLFQTKCACLLLNSMVKSVLDYVAPLIDKFENLHLHVCYFKSTDFRKFVRSKGARFSHIGLNTPDKWNTTYRMLDRMVKEKLHIVEYYATCGERDIDIDNTDWETIESLLGILEVFHGSIIRLSDSYYPTTPLLLGEVLLIAHMFKEHKQKPFWEQVIMEMQSKLLKYYETIPPLFSCATALNPKIGIGGVENILKDIEEYLGLDANNMGDGDYAKNSMTKCSDVLLEMFCYYDKMYKSRGRERNMATESGSRNIIMESVLRKKSRSVAISNELELYTKTDFSNVMSYEEYESCNMLKWWRDKGRHQYPIMAEMVRDMVTVQASTVSLELAFCLNGKVLDDLTAWELKPQLEVKRMFLKEHYGDIDGREKVDLDDDDDDYDDDDDDDDDDEGEDEDNEGKEQVDMVDDDNDDGDDDDGDDDYNDDGNDDEDDDICKCEHDELCADDNSDEEYTS